MSRVSSDIGPAPEEQTYRLILFVADRERNSIHARENLEQIRATHLKGRCEVQIVDVLKDYRTALQHNVLVTPCLLKLEPLPRVLIAGTLHDVDKVRTALQLPDL